MKQRLMDADKYCEFLNTYPLEKAQSNFMAFYKDALQHTFECEVEAIPVEWIEKQIEKALCVDSVDMFYVSHLKYLIKKWKKENETKID